MVAPNFNSLCKEAELYYCDFLCKEGHELVPEFIIDHIKQCQRCQEQLSRLTRVLSITEGHIESEEGQISSAITIMLKLHLAYIGKPVTCETVKPFLPSLLDPALEIGIPTPITVHLDNCQKCSEDLETIRGLNLNRKQLRRLSQLFADKPAEDNVSCSQAQAAILAVVSMAFHETNEEVLKHLSVCPDCRKVLYQYRETVRKEYLHNGAEWEKFPCEAVSATDIFDYVVPYGLNPASDQYAKFRESLTSHLRTCPNCLAKMQELHKTIYGICERPESEVITVYHIDESAKAKAVSETEELYAGFPIRVDVKQREEEVKAEQPVPAIDFAAALKQKVSIEKLKPLLKTAVAAAAIILIAVALIFNIPTAKAVTLSQIYKALEGVKNVYISSFVPGREEPIQKQWVSRTLNIYINRTEEQLVFWDLSNRVRKSKHLDTGLTETAALTDNIVAGLEKKLTGSLGLVPFYDISDVPQDAEWSRVADNGLEDITKGTEVYDLTWIERKHIGFVTFRKWRVFANAETNLPQKVEWYKKLAANDEFALETIMVVEYLHDSEVQEVTKEASF
jgi:hypothetical protein